MTDTRVNRPTPSHPEGPAQALILSLVVFRTSIHVRLAIAQHGVDGPGQLVCSGGNGLGRSQVGFLPAQEGAQGAVGAVQRVGGQTQCCRRPAGALALVRELMTLPPEMRLLGLSPSYDAKRLAFSRFVMSVPTSLTTLRAV